MKFPQTLPARRRAVPLLATLGVALLAAACTRESAGANRSAASGAPETSAAAAPDSSPTTPRAGDTGPVTALPPNELGRVPILEWHLLGDTNTMWTVRTADFRRQLQLLYDRGYRPVTIRQLLDRDLDLPAGTSPVVLVFDDASPSQFRYVEREGQLEIDSTSAVGMLLEFNRRNPAWKNRAVFCMLPAAEAGRSFFGNKDIEGQKTEWRFRKVRFLAEQGFELCNHTLWHAQLSRYPDAFVQEQVARGEMAIDSAVPGYDVRTFALPLGLWPKNRPLAWQGAWTDPKTKKTFTYAYDAVLEVAGGPARSPFDPQFDPKKLPRVIVHHDDLAKLLDQLDRHRTRYVSDGDPERVARPATAATPSSGTTGGAPR